MLGGLLIRAEHNFKIFLVIIGIWNNYGLQSVDCTIAKVCYFIPKHSVGTVTFYTSYILHITCNRTI